jgi:hypothetical protein
MSMRTVLTITSMASLAMAVVSLICLLSAQVSLTAGVIFILVFVLMAIVGALEAQNCPY